MYWNTTDFSFFFHIQFISFSCLISLARTSSKMLNRSGEIRHHCLVSDHRGKAFKLLTLSMMLIVGLFYMAFIILRFILSTANLLRVFIMNGCWTKYLFLDARVVVTCPGSITLLGARHPLCLYILASIKMIILYLSFIVAMWCTTFIDFAYVEPSLHPRDEPTWSWCIILSVCWWIQFVSIFWDFLHLYSSGILACSVLLWLLYQDNTGLVNWDWKCSLLFNFLGRVWEDLALMLLLFFKIFIGV